MNPNEVLNTKSLIKVKEACIDDSTFECVSLAKANFFDVNFSGTKITNADMSDIEIKDAQLGGAYIHDIGLPPEDHPAYVPGAKQRPITFENCDLVGSTLVNCNLSKVTILDCETTGLIINGYVFEDLLMAYKISIR